jgi:hypothetical protein
MVAPATGRGKRVWVGVGETSRDRRRRSRRAIPFPARASNGPFPNETVRGGLIFFQDAKIVGNALACPALAHASAEERRQMKEQYGLACA